MALFTPFTAGAAVQVLADDGKGPELRAMIHEYSDIAIDWLSHSNNVTAALSALQVACLAREALRWAENKGIIERLPDTLTPEEIEGIAL